MRPKKTHDVRGAAALTYSQTEFAAHGIHDYFSHEFVSWSHKNVLRGMHYQASPMAKVVRCVRGSALDVVVDMRQRHGGVWAAVLSEDEFEAVYVPPWCAHGFLALSDKVEMHYKLTAERDVSTEVSVRWDSIGFAWPCKDPILSERDCVAVTMEEWWRGQREQH